jgi:hypothetical protein
VYQQRLRARVKCNDVVGKCCNEPTHIENFNSTEYSYEDELLEFQDQQRRLLKMWRMAAGLNFDILEYMEPLLRSHTTSSGGTLWKSF